VWPPYIVGLESRRLIIKISILWKWIYFDKLVGAKRLSSNFGPWGVFGSAVLGSAVLGVCGPSSTVSISIASSSLTRANADLQYQKLWRTLQRFVRETQISAAEVQWTRLAMKKPPTWSRLPPAQPFVETYVRMIWIDQVRSIAGVFVVERSSSIQPNPTPLVWIKLYPSIREFIIFDGFHSPWKKIL